MDRLNAPTHNTNLRDTINKILRDNNMADALDKACCELLEAKQCSRAKRNQGHHQRKLQQVSLWRQAVRRIAATKAAVTWTRSSKVDFAVSEIIFRVGYTLLRRKKWRRKRKLYNVVENLIEYNKENAQVKDRHKNCVQ